MTSIESQTKKSNYEIEIKSGSGHTVLADEPIASGGKNKGMAPDEFLIAGLAACISATLEMYAQRKEWDLQVVHTSIKFIDGEKSNDIPSIQTDIRLEGNLDEDQKKRLMVIAGKCPIHKMLTTGMEINASLT
ncbi:OsmC family peroxiredoxin [Brumimicrobium glaciale]|uniref:OsmC family peroxiredoxin n=1 Tax=Brumimicrobium glaciale TaxID=200475 RepID=A0A4Q4KQG4_9FLAO|nr:OsmC family protein [Brumimicrobium glaciale]RYM35127.1 OsmC family peroxiredoxin [Brumimicrobium glaciale]